MNRPGQRNILLCIVALATAVILFVQPDACRTAVAQGLQLCGGTLLAGIFPFLIVTNLIVSSGCAGVLSLPLRPLARLLGCRSQSGAAILLLGGVGGFAPAAQAAAGLTRSGELDARDASWLLAAAAGSSPTFVILTVGGQMLGNTTLGMRLYLCQLIAGVGSVWILQRFRPRSNPHRKFTASRTAPNTEPAPVPMFSGGLAAAIGDAAVTYLRLCGFVIYFRIAANAVGAVFPTEYAFLPAIFLEVSSGCSMAAQQPVIAVFWCCTALSLMGLSVFLQIRAICPDEISLRPLLLSRPIHLLIAQGLLRLSLGGEQAASVYSSLEARVILLPRLSLPCALLLFAVCLLMCDQLCRTLQSERKRL